MLFTFLVCLAGMALLWLALVRFELASKATKGKLSRLRRALDGEARAASRSRIAPTVPSRVS
jgi:hypothetical protein